MSASWFANFRITVGEREGEEKRERERERERVRVRNGVGKREREEKQRVCFIEVKTVTRWTGSAQPAWTPT